MSLAKWEHVNAFTEKSVEECYVPESKSNMGFVSEHGMLIDIVTRILGAVEVLENTCGDLFTEDCWLYRSLRLSRNQSRIVSAVAIDYALLRKSATLFRLHPHIEVFLKCYECVRPENPHSVGQTGLQSCFAKLNDYVRTIRAQLHSSATKRKVAASARAVDKNFQGLVDYIDAMFECRSRLLVLRMDFSYRKNEQELKVSVFTEDDVRRVTSRIAKHRVELLKYLKAKCPELGMVGYAWKLEYGREKGHHYHMIFFLDGTKVREDIVIAKKIGEHWNKVITGGAGLYFNCNRKKDSYRHCGVGMVNYYDAEKISSLKFKAAIYLTKADFYVGTAMPDNSRCFGKGNAPKVVRSGGGRPRLY
ncbi:MAG: inovirus Gp2 family protein [Proteobacteria bacterium]|nr:MAG: inovirus Gp2 family protein [Pseudomonadota bacterium]